MLSMLNKRDRARLDRLSQKIDEYHRRVDDTDDPIERGRYLALSRRAESSRKMQRTFPGSIVLWGVAANLVLIPWALLGRTGHETWGVVGSFIVIGLLVLTKLLLRSRQTENRQ